MKICEDPNCSNELVGAQRKWCSQKCRQISVNARFQNYLAQQERGKETKQKIVQMKGGGCEKCGYNKCFAALNFHHRDPSIKKFQLDYRSLANRKWSLILEELEKCDLLCSNCHMEEHYLHLDEK